MFKFLQPQVNKLNSQLPAYGRGVPEFPLEARLNSLCADGDTPRASSCRR